MDSKIAVITGAGRGLGRSTALHLACQSVGSCARSPQTATGSGMSRASRANSGRPFSSRSSSTSRVSVRRRDVSVVPRQCSRRRRPYQSQRPGRTARNAADTTWRWVTRPERRALRAPPNRFERGDSRGDAYSDCAGGGTRTHTPFRAKHFECSASAIPPIRRTTPWETIP